jgi:hypothetical protein
MTFHIVGVSADAFSIGDRPCFTCGAEIPPELFLLKPFVAVDIVAGEEDTYLGPVCPTCASAGPRLRESMKRFADDLDNLGGSKAHAEYLRDAIAAPGNWSPDPEHN